MNTVRYCTNLKTRKMDKKEETTNKNSILVHTEKSRWERNDALKVLKLEKELQQNVATLILKFPDPEINENIVKAYSPQIESVEIEQPYPLRYCFVKLKKDADIAEVCNQLSQISFGAGKIIAEPKWNTNSKEINENRNLEGNCHPENIDPFTLHIDNLPMTINVEIIKDYFPNSNQIIIDCCEGDNKSIYALIHFKTVHDAMEAYKSALNMSIGSHKLIVKFKRHKDINVNSLGKTSFPSNSKEGSNNGECNKNSTDNQDDEDVIYVSDKIIKIEDSEKNVRKEVQRMAEISVNNNSSVGVVDVKQEPMNEKTDNTPEWLSTTIKDERIDENDLSSEAGFYEDEGDYSDYDNEPEEVDDTAHTSEDAGTRTQQQIKTDCTDYREREFSEQEKKPDIKKITVPLPISFYKSSQKAVKRSSLFISDGNKTMNDHKNIEKDVNQIATKKTAYRDELDELFERMNSEDDEFNF